MKSVRMLLRTVWSMRLLGSILILMALAVLAGSLAAAGSLATFTMAWQHVDALAVLEDPVSAHLRQIEIDELAYLAALDYEMNDTAGRGAPARNAGEIDRLVGELVAAGHYTTEAGYLEEDMALLDDFQELLADHDETWNRLRDAYEAGEAEIDAADLETLRGEHQDLQLALEELVARLEADRLAAGQALPQDSSLAIEGVSVALVALLILALWGYRAIARLCLPVVELTNAVVALGADRYRPELLGDERRAGGPAGVLARALDRFAGDIEQRDAGLKQEVESLNERLRESRRQRLKIARPTPADGSPLP